MKKSILYLACAIAAMVSASCTKEYAVQPELQVFSASSPDVKTSLSGTSILWNPGDEINVYNGENGTGAVFTTSITSPSASAEFTGSGAAQISGKYYAFYPASAFLSNPSRSFSNKYVYFGIPQEQVAVKGQLPASTNVMVAESAADNHFTFNHCAAFLKFTLDSSSPAISAISFVAQDCKVSGTFRVTFSSMAIGTYSLDGNVNYDNVRLKSADGNALEAGSYYMAVRGMTYAKGVKFVFQRADGKVAVKSIASSCSLAAGDLMDMGNVRLSDADFVDPSLKIATAYSSGNDKGVIVWINPANPLEAKIVSAWASTKKAFVSDASVTGFGDLACKNADGSVNVATMKATDAYKNAPEAGWAFLDCEKAENGFGDGGWYLPSTTELRYVYAASHGIAQEDASALVNATVIAANSEAQDKFNAALVEAGGTKDAFKVQQYLWSSETISAGNKIIYGRFDKADGSLQWYSGNNAFTSTCMTRCVKKVTISY